MEIRHQKQDGVELAQVFLQMVSWTFFQLFLLLLIAYFWQKKSRVSDGDLTEKFVSLVPVAIPVKWQNFKTALHYSDLTEKLGGTESSYEM